MADSDGSETSRSTPIKDQFAAVIKSFEEQAVNGAISNAEVDSIHDLLKSCTSFVLRYTNSRRSVNRLPPEILRVVFLDYVQLADFADLLSGKVKDVGWPHTFTRIRDALSLSHVCRRWRELAHDFPALWTSIRDAHAEETREFLSRTKGLPLKVLIAADTRTDWFWDICMEHGDSIEELHWVSGKNNGGELISIPALDNQAPNVQRLSLSRSAGDQTRYRNISILRGATENVTILSLNDINWVPTNIFPALTHLVFSGSVTLTEFLAFLTRCPNLRTLILRNGVTLTSPDAPPSLGPVQLPRLQKLSVDLNPCEPLRPFLTCLEFNRRLSAVEIGMSVLRTSPTSPIGRLEIPDGLYGPIFTPSDYINAPLTRVYCKQASVPHGASSIMVLGETCAVRFASPLPLAFEHSSLLSAKIALHLVTELWLEGIDHASFELFVAFRGNMPALQTVSVVHPERVARAPMALSMFVQSLRMPRRYQPPVVGPPTMPTLRVVFGSAPRVRAVGHHIWNPDDDDGVDRVIRDLGGFGGRMPLGERKNRLIVRAPEFPAEYYDTVLPALIENWESVETEVNASGCEIPPVTQEEAGFPAWKAW